MVTGWVDIEDLTSIVSYILHTYQDFLIPIFRKSNYQFTSHTKNLKYLGLSSLLRTPISFAASSDLDLSQDSKSSPAYDTWKHRNGRIIGSNNGSDA